MPRALGQAPDVRNRGPWRVGARPWHRRSDFWPKIKYMSFDQNRPLRRAGAFLVRSLADLRCPGPWARPQTCETVVHGVWEHARGTLGVIFGQKSNIMIWGTWVPLGAFMCLGACGPTVFGVWVLCVACRHTRGGRAINFG